MTAIFATLLGLPRWLKLALGGVLALAAAFVWLHSRDSGNREIGSTQQREADLRETLERTEDANRARDDIRRDVDGARYAQCLRTARTPANCERFMPGIQTPVR